MKKYFGLILCLCSGFLALAQTTTMVTLSADGRENSYSLALVQRILFRENGKNSTMSIVHKGGEETSNVRRILFAKSEDVPTSVEESGVAQVYAFPNPVTSMLYIQGIDADASLNVFSLTGSLVLQSSGTELNVSELPRGTYLLQIENQVIKFIKK